MRWLLIATLLLSGVAHSEPLRVLAVGVTPFIYEDEEGQPMGLEFDILSSFAHSQGQTLEVVWVERFNELLPGLERGEAEIASGTITITAARAQRVDFSDSYFPVQLRLIHRAAQPVNDLSELEGEKIGVLPGTTGARAAASAAKVELAPRNTIRELFDGVASGEFRGLVTDTSLALLYLEEFDSLKFGPVLSEVQHYGFALRSHSPLLQPLNRHLERLKRSGIYFRLLEKHFGPRAVTMVKTVQE